MDVGGIAAPQEYSLLSSLGEVDALGSQAQLSLEVLCVYDPKVCCAPAVPSYLRSDHASLQNRSASFSMLRTSSMDHLSMAQKPNFRFPSSNLSDSDRILLMLPGYTE